MKSSAMIVLALSLAAAHMACADPLPAAPSEAPKPHSFLEPVGDFIQDGILHPKQPFTLVPGKDADGWAFVLEPYAWAIGLSGDIGVKGFPPSQFGISSRSVIQSLDWGIFFRGEVRKGRWGVLGDGYYADLSSSGSLDNKLYSDISASVQQSIVSAALAYRIIDDRRGYLDIYAGARYNFLGLQASSSLNDSRVNQVGSTAADAIASRLDEKIGGAIQDAVAAAKGTARLRAEDFVSERLEDREVRRILQRDRDVRRLLRDRVIRESLTGGRVSQALGEYVRSVAAAKVAEARGIPDPSLSATREQAKQRLATAISRRIEEVTPTSAAGDQWWFDPIIGLRGQINLTRWLFLSAQGDVGGFGAGSRIAWTAQASVGLNFTRNLFGEFGYRYMYVDYENGGFLYNMNSYGLYTGLGVKF